MNITPLDIRKQTFKRVFRGYDEEEVQAFLEVLAEEFERLNREAIVLREKQTSLQTEVDHFRAMEQTLQEMLRTAQQAAEEVKENGRKEARLIVKDSEIRGNRAIEKARAQVHTIRAEIVDLKNQRDMFVSKFQALVQAQGDFLGQLKFTDPDVVQETVQNTEPIQDDESEDTQA